MVLLILLVPACAAVALCAVPDAAHALARRIAVAATGIPLAATVWLVTHYDAAAGGYRVGDSAVTRP